MLLQHSTFYLSLLLALLTAGPSSKLHSLSFRCSDPNQRHQSNLNLNLETAYLCTKRDHKARTNTDISPVPNFVASVASIKQTKITQTALSSLLLSKSFVPKLQPNLGKKARSFVPFPTKSKNCTALYNTGSCRFRWPNSNPNPNLKQGTRMTSCYTGHWRWLTKSHLRTVEALQNPLETWISTAFDFLSLTFRANYFTYTCKQRDIQTDTRREGTSHGQHKPNIAGPALFTNKLVYRMPHPN